MIYYIKMLVVPPWVDIPATIGACFAKKKKEEKYYLYNGDGSFSLISELQLINHHKLNANIFVINNDGYSSMKQSEVILQRVLDIMELTLKVE